MAGEERPLKRQKVGDHGDNAWKGKGKRKASDNNSLNTEHSCSHASVSAFTVQSQARYQASRLSSPSSRIVVQVLIDSSGSGTSEIPCSSWRCESKYQCVGIAEWGCGDVRDE